MRGYETNKNSKHIKEKGKSIYKNTDILRARSQIISEKSSESCFILNLYSTQKNKLYTGEFRLTYPYVKYQFTLMKYAIKLID